jgi:hypothetical protein
VLDNTLNIYNNIRKTISGSLYQLDDTHWNEKATKIIASEIAKNEKLQLAIRKK